MSRRKGHTAPAGDGHAAAVDDLVAVPRSELAAVTELVGTLREEVTRLREAVLFRRPEVPRTRKYTKREVGVRIVFGMDPRHVPEEDWKEGLSERTVDRLAAAGALQPLVIGGQVFFSELEVQAYEDGLADGYIEGYRVVKSRQKKVREERDRRLKRAKK